MPSRRDALRHGLLLSAGLAIEPRRWSELVHQPVPDLTFDLHLHPGEFFARGTATYAGDDGFRSRLEEMRGNGMHGGFISLVADAPLLQRTPTGIQVTRSFQAGEALQEFRRQRAILRELMPQSKARVVGSMTEFRSAVRDGMTGAWLACEGSEFLNGDAGRVDDLWEEGVRSIQLVHYAPNAAGDLQTQPAQHNGLSAFGKAVVQRMRARRMLIDVAHAAQSTVADVVRLVDGPIMLSHTILKISDERLLNARAITPEHARLVASTGGVIGAWPSATNASFAEFVENTKRLADVVGVDHVGLGTDMDSNLRPVLSSYRQLRDWTAGLAAHGFTAAEVAQMAGGNMVRVLSQLMP